MSSVESSQIEIILKEVKYKNIQLIHKTTEYLPRSDHELFNYSIN